MSKQRKERETLEVTMGYAADARRGGVAYATLQRGSARRSLRIPFRLPSQAGDGTRAAGYAALRAVAAAVRADYNGHVRFIVGDDALAADLRDRRPLPTSLSLAYVAARCSLNRFTGAEVAFSPSPDVLDLTARANAEVSLNIAA